MEGNVVNFSDRRKVLRRKQVEGNGGGGLRCRHALCVIAGELRGGAEQLSAPAPDLAEVQRIGRYLVTVSGYLERLAGQS